MKYSERSFSYIQVPVLILVMVLSSCSGGKKVFSSLDRTFEDSPVFENGFVGLALYDPSEEKMLYQYNASKYFTPASNTKLLTFYTGIKILGDSIPGIEYAIVGDSLVFSGTGDPSLLHPELPGSPVLEFLRENEQELYYLPSITPVTPFGPGWAWDDYNAYYSVERSPLPVYGNQVSFEPLESQVPPEVFPSRFIDSLHLERDLNNRIKRDLHKNTFRYPRNFRYRTSRQIIPFKTSAETNIDLLEDTLHRNIEILEIRPSFTLDKILYSIPADSIYKRMLQVSDNFIAEQILLLAANKISDTLKTGIAIDFMKKTFLEDLPDSLKWVDGSGLSRYNLTTPRNMIRLLEKIKEEVPEEKLFELLPSGGKSGTIQDQFKSDVPFIFAKTGSLSNNYSLSGYLITRKGKVLLFSFMNSNYVTPSALLKNEMERMLRNIRNNY